eukprot:2818983-Rhodomonas_salina.2
MVLGRPPPSCPTSLSLHPSLLLSRGLWWWCSRVPKPDPSDGGLMGGVWELQGGREGGGGACAVAVSVQLAPLRRRCRLRSNFPGRSPPAPGPPPTHPAPHPSACAQSALLCACFGTALPALAALLPPALPLSLSSSVPPAVPRAVVVVLPRPQARSLRWWMDGRGQRVEESMALRRRLADGER